MLMKPPFENVSQVAIDKPTNDRLHLKISLENRGVAPFYVA